MRKHIAFSAVSAVRCFFAVSITDPGNLRRWILPGTDSSSTLTFQLCRQGLPRRIIRTGESVPLVHSGTGSSGALIPPDGSEAGEMEILKKEKTDA
jgi:hypothetical protein